MGPPGWRIKRQTRRHPAACAGSKQRISLNSADRIYAELRDRSFAAVGPELRKRAMAIQSDYKTSKVVHQSLPASLAAKPLLAPAPLLLLRPVNDVSLHSCSASGPRPECGS